MYMNVNGILAAQRPGAGLAGSPWRRLQARTQGVRWQLRARLARVSAACWQGLPGRRAPGLREPLSAPLAVPGRFMFARQRWGGPGSARPRCRIPA